MVLKVYGLVVSAYTQIVIVTLKELKVPFEVVPVDYEKELKSEEYRTTKQPFGQTPVLVEDDGFQLYESRAIARYLVAKYGPQSGLIPTDLKALGKFEQAASVEHSNFQPYAAAYAVESVLKPLFRGIKGDEARAEENKTKLEANLKVYDTILSKQKYLAGDEFTLADIFHYPFAAIITEQGGFTALTSEKLPHVARWWADITGREAWKEVIAERDVAFAAFKK